VVNKILKEKGVLGFYKGISASYFGIAESAICFAMYEHLKSISNEQINSDSNSKLKLLSYFTSAGFAKTVASCICYPHGT
jgi:solute carrier family 25 protein 33/36